MATNILTSSSIDSLVSSYITSETQRLITPVTNKTTKYQNVVSAYGTLSSKMSSFKTLLADLKTTDTDSVFNSKSVNSSDTNVLTATAANNASTGSFSMRVNQLAKNDLLLSNSFNTSDASGLTGTQQFTIKTGDGSGGEYTSNVEVTFDGTENYQTALSAISDAINKDEASVTSTEKTAANAYTGGASTFTLDIGGTETSISVNGGGTYDDLLNEIIGKVNGVVNGVKAEKVVDANDPTKESIKFTLTDSSKYLTIKSGSGFDVVSDLGVAVTQEKAAGSIVSASEFNPTTSTTRLSLTAKDTGVDYRISGLSDSGSSNVLTTLGINLGSSRPAYDEVNNPSSAGFIYSDITDTNNQLNSKFLFNGISIQRDSNSITDLVPGVTLNLQSTMQSSDQDVNVLVGNDIDTVKGKIQNFIDQFNDIYTYIRSNSKSTSSQTATFSGDINASTLSYFFQSIIFSKVSGIPNGDINSLTQLGITFDSSSGLSISDSTKLDSALTNSPEQVAALFNNDNGIANTIYNKINPYLGNSGYLNTSINSLNNNITSLNDKQTRYQDMINKEADTLRNQYEKLQIQLASLMSLQNMLGMSSTTTS